MIVSGNLYSRARRGFSLLEVLLAMFILGIGLVMVATIFPVGADWTRQANEDSVAQTIALNAVAVIKDAYAANSLNTNTAGKLANIPATPTNLQGLPAAGLAVAALPSQMVIPVGERCYRYGNDNPFPVANPAVSSYYWTAMVRPVPAAPNQPATGNGRNFDVYIFVFRKGDANQTFKLTGSSVFLDSSNNPALTINYPGDEVAGARDTITPPSPEPAYFPANMHCNLEPTLVHKPYSAGTSAKNGTDCVPPMGYIGVGLKSGTVFRQSYDYVNNLAIPRPGLFGTEDVIFAPPADGTSGSPLIYVYQTTVSF